MRRRHQPCCWLICISRGTIAFDMRHLSGRIHRHVRCRDSVVDSDRTARKCMSDLVVIVVVMRLLIRSRRKLQIIICGDLRNRKERVNVEQPSTTVYLHVPLDVVVIAVAISSTNDHSSKSASLPGCCSCCWCGVGSGNGVVGRYFIVLIDHRSKLSWWQKSQSIIYTLSCGPRSGPLKTWKSDARFVAFGWRHLLVDVRVPVTGLRGTRDPMKYSILDSGAMCCQRIRGCHQTKGAFEVTVLMTAETTRQSAVIVSCDRWRKHLTFHP